MIKPEERMREPCREILMLLGMKLGQRRRNRQDESWDQGERSVHQLSSDTSSCRTVHSRSHAATCCATHRGRELRLFAAQMWPTSDLARRAPLFAVKSEPGREQSAALRYAAVRICPEHATRGRQSGVLSIWHSDLVSRTRAPSRLARMNKSRRNLIQKAQWAWRHLALVGVRMFLLMAILVVFGPDQGFSEGADKTQAVALEAGHTPAGHTTTSNDCHAGVLCHILEGHWASDTGLTALAVQQRFRFGNTLLVKAGRPEVDPPPPRFLV